MASTRNWCRTARLNTVTEQLSWNEMTAWELTQRDGGRGSLAIATAVPVHPNNPHCVV